MPVLLSLVVFCACYSYASAELPYCAANSSLKYCIRPCPLTCQNKDMPHKCDQPRCSDETLYKCECDYGYVLNGDRCILEADCPQTVYTETPTTIKVITLPPEDLLVDDIEDGDDVNNPASAGNSHNPEDNTSSDKSVPAEIPSGSSDITSSIIGTTST